MFFENMISRADMKYMLAYGCERDLGLVNRLLGGSKQNCGCQCSSLQQQKKEKVVGVECVGVDCYKGKECCGHQH
jgi:hypothetical protein